MEIQSKAWARFVRVKLQNYMMFDENSEITFSNGKTVIAGPVSSNRTQIFHLLESLSKKVEVEGNFELLRKYGHFFFINSDPMPQDWRNMPYACIPCGGHRFSEEIISWDFFQEMIATRQGKEVRIEDFDFKHLSQQEKRCWWYASAFATKQVLKLNLPIVIDSPYAMLDNKLRQGVNAFLKKQSGQLILIGVESEFVGLEKSDFILEPVGSSVKVRKNINKLRRTHDRN